MRVTVVAGGIPTPEYPIHGIFEYTQAKALANAGIEVCYLALDFRPLNAHRHLLLKRSYHDGINIYHFSLPTGVYRHGLWLLQRLALRLFKIIEKEQGHQDIIHTHFYSISAICSLIPSHCGVKMVATEHSSKLNKPLVAISALDMNIARAAYRNAAAVITVSECLAVRLKENFGVKSIVIGNIVSNAFACVRYVNHYGFNIISVGRLITGKRFDDLIRAFAAAVAYSSKAGLTLTIVGDGPMSGELKRLICELGVETKVKLYGKASSDEIQRLMSTADLFALLSESETFGVAYAEALTAGIPVLATRCGGPDGFVTAENGILVDVGDVNSAAKAICDIADGSLKFNEDKIRRSASKFEPSWVARELIELYKSV